ncbi:MAG: MBL fold metallo-hydrolase [Myxococcales bacterium]|nr:MBL fold metallo-hydrolase [Myxococcales bacterium]
MKIHHLNCVTMCPVACKSLFKRSHFVAHCLLVESPDGLILIDTGFGMAEVEQRGKRVGRLYAKMMGPAFDPAETAVAQVQALGFKPADVRHIVVTHLDLDHAGGLSDFPHAQVHVFAEEHAAAMKRETLPEKGRYLPVQWAHGPDWHLHAVEEGEGWHGFERVRPLPGVVPDVLLVPVRGHTRGHCAVAVKGDDGWWLHCGDAYFDRRSIAAPDEVPRGIQRLEKILAFDNDLRRRNLGRLQELFTAQGASLHMICAHDPVEFPTP